MTVTLRIPPSLRTLTGDSPELYVPAGTVDQVIEAADAVHPGLRARLVDQNGHLHRYINLFVGTDDIRFLDGLDTPVADYNTVSVVAAVAGG